MLQIRITDSDGSNPIILENTENRSYFKSINLGEEGVNFEISKNSPKADILNPDNGGYKKFWEVWNIDTNERLNYGPLTSIEESGPNWKVTGSGRSAILADFRKSIKTFYGTIDSILDDLRYENIAVQPRAKTIVYSNDANTIIGTVTPNEKYQGLSKNTKDNAIDDDNGYIKPGQIEPSNTYYSTNSYWMGQSKADSLVVDLGGTYNLSKISLLLPWWGGAERLGNRTYDWAIDYSDGRRTLGPGDIRYRQRILVDWNEVYSSPDDNRLMSSPTIPYRLYLGTTVSGTSIERGTIYAMENIPGPLPVRYLRVRIRDVHAWFGTIYDDQPPHDGWAFQCDSNYQAGDDPYLKPTLQGVMHGKVINDRELEPSNDCYASIVEVGAYQQIVPRDDIKPLALQRIDDTNPQITYYHVADASETITTDNGFRKFEPGGYFRKFKVTYSGASTSFTKFFDSDCTNCYPDGYNFAIMDQNNTLIYATDNTSGTNVAINAPAYSSTLLMKGASNAVITYADAWPSVTDPFSWGSSYSYTEVANDYLTVHFKGQSFRWYASIPPDKTGATVKIEIRHKSAPRADARSGFPGHIKWQTAAWSAWSTLENSYVLPNDISAELVYEISFESGILSVNTVYEIRITNLDGNYCSVDSFEGYWSGSLTKYNEDSHRIGLDDVSKFIQIYDQRFSGGSMYKISQKSRSSFSFLGDRVILYGAKSVNAGVFRIALLREGLNGSLYDDNTDNKMDIPGSDSNQILKVNLRTGKTGNEITQAVIFDSNDYFVDGLPWDNYNLVFNYDPADGGTYSTTDVDAQDSFIPRCSDCTPATGNTISVNRPVYIDGVAAHEAVGLSVSFENETHLDITKAIIEAIQTEGDITEDGLLITPRLGIDSNEVLREGQNTLVDYSIVNDISQVASMLVSNGSDIDGLPLFTITEDKKTREDLGRTIMRSEDFRQVADYFQLIGLSRTSLRKRKKPEKRITVTHIAKSFSLERGDSFILYTKKMGPFRVRINKVTITETTNGGTVFELECVRWPQII